MIAWLGYLVTHWTAYGTDQDIANARRRFYRRLSPDAWARRAPVYYLDLVIFVGMIGRSLAAPLSVVAPWLFVGGILGGVLTFGSIIDLKRAGVAADRAPRIRLTWSELVMMIENECGVDMSVMAGHELRTMGQMHDFLSRQLGVANASTRAQLWTRLVDVIEREQEVPRERIVRDSRFREDLNVRQ